jgi:hypothetical protein
MLFLNRLFSSPSAQEKGYINELRTTFRKIPAFESKNELLPDMAWLRNINVLQKNVLNRDPRRFLRWNVISGTMFTGNASYIAIELKYLKDCSDWNMRWAKAIEESAVCDPELYPSYPPSSGNLIHHAYHGAQFEERTGIRVDNLNYIFDFGGGYESMCRLFFNLGFKGIYVIFDLPPFSVPQRYFLMNLGLPVLSLNNFNEQKAGIFLLTGCARA